MELHGWSGWVGEVSSGGERRQGRWRNRRFRGQRETREPTGNQREVEEEMRR